MVREQGASMPTRLYIGIATRVVVGLAVVAACAQHEGERCQIHSDCASNVCCKINPAATPSDDGICTATQAACDELRGQRPNVDAGTDVPADTAAESGTGAETAGEIVLDAAGETGADIAADTADETPVDIAPDASEETHIGPDAGA